MSAPSFLRTVTTLISSQNHRVVGVGRDLYRSSSPSPLPKQGHLQQAAQDLVQVGLEYLQRRRLRNLPGQHVPVLRCFPLPMPLSTVLTQNENVHRLITYIFKKINKRNQDKFLIFRSVQGLLSKEDKEDLDLPFQGKTLACVAMKLVFIWMPSFETAR